MGSGTLTTIFAASAIWHSVVFALGLVTYERLAKRWNLAMTVRMKWAAAAGVTNYCHASLATLLSVALGVSHPALLHAWSSHPEENIIFRERTTFFSTI